MFAEEGLGITKIDSSIPGELAAKLGDSKMAALELTGPHDETESGAFDTGSSVAQDRRLDSLKPQQSVSSKAWFTFHLGSWQESS